MKKLNLLKIASAALLATAAMAAQAAGPDWSLIITGPGIVVPPAPAQVAPVRVAPVVVAPPVAMPPPASTAAVQGHRDNRDGRADDGWERNRDRDRQFQDRFQERFQERENYWLERERAFLAREKAFLEREKQRQLVVENNQRASAAINDRQEQQVDRIVEGVNNGRITKDEFINLMAQQKQISNQERQFLADGFLSQDEFARLNAALDQAGQGIRSERRDRRQPRERI
jgi:hypothetical protein